MQKTVQSRAGDPRIIINRPPHQSSPIRPWTFIQARTCGGKGDLQVHSRLPCDPACAPCALALRISSLAATEETIFR